MAKAGRRAQNIDPLQANQVDEVVEYSGPDRKQLVDHADYDHRGDEIRRIGHHLHGLFKERVPGIADAQGQDDRHREG
jgi:hypothetical protein